MFGSAMLGLGLLSITACSTSAPAPAAATPSPVSAAQTAAPDPDPRVGLRAGKTDAGEASWNMRLVVTRPSPPGIDEAWNSDLAFLGDYVFQGNFNGFTVWDASNPADPRVLRAYVCPASQSDVSVYQNLLFVSSESTSGRLDCGTEAPQEPVSHDRLRGIRIFDISDINNPRYIHNVQTCRGSHTHSLVTDPNDPANVYIYVSGSARVRPPAELAGCSELSPDEDPNSSLFRIEVIQVPLAAPQTARIVTAARVFAGMEAAPRRSGGGGGRGRGGEAPDAPRRGPNQCHDITAYPAVGLAGGACQGYGILIDIRNPAEPRRLSAVADTNFATWHSVSFNNDGTKVLWTDEWGGGTAPRCRATDNEVWGGNAIFRIVNQRAEFLSYYKMPAAQTDTENCVAHNGSLIPVPGRDIKVQGWYQGGISIFDWTDGSNPVEIAFFDRGPFIADTLRTAGSWSAYWFNGYIYSSEIERGLDVFELQPSAFLTQNEIDAAKSVQLDYFNAQEQQKFVWPPSFALTRAYLDQLERSNGLDAARITAIRSELARVERLAGQTRSGALLQLAGQLDSDAQRAQDAAKARLLAAAVRDLADS
ncbi:MAG: LVIVD repeat-containing protein [Longimicrobiales bacterium]